MRTHRRTIQHLAQLALIYTTLIPGTMTTILTTYTLLLLCQFCTRRVATGAHVVVGKVAQHRRCIIGCLVIGSVICIAGSSCSMGLRPTGQQRLGEFEPLIYATKEPRNPARDLDIQTRLFESGIEHQPGPPWLPLVHLLPQLLGNCPADSTTRKKAPKRGFELVVGNITCLTTHLEQVSSHQADALIFQEHSCPMHEWAKVHKHMRARRKKVILGQLDPDSRHNLGGLGIATLHSRRATKVQPMTKAFTDAVATGRVDHYALDIGHDTALSIYNVYGWTGGHQNRKQAQRTDCLFAAIHDEVLQQAEGPSIIVGDINGDPDDFKSLADMVANSGWTDIGAQAHIWGQPQKVPTCIAPNTTMATRRDYIFASSQALPLISHFEVKDMVDFPVHSFLHMTLSPAAVEQTVNKDIRPASLSKKFEDFCEKLTTDLDEDKAKSLRETQICKYHHALDKAINRNMAVFQRYLNRTTIVEGIRNQVDPRAERDLNRTTNVDGIRNQVDPCSDTTSYWRLWNNFVESTFCELFVPTADHRKYKGRGHNNIKKQRLRRTMPAEHGTEDNASGIEMPHLDKEVAVLGKQTARCKQWASRLKRLHSIQHSGAPSNSTVGTLHKLNLEATRCICKDLDLTNAYECEMKSVIFL